MPGLVTTSADRIKHMGSEGEDIPQDALSSLQLGETVRYDNWTNL